MYTQNRPDALRLRSRGEEDFPEGRELKEGGPVRSLATERSEKGDSEDMRCLGKKKNLGSAGEGNSLREESGMLSSGRGTKAF